MTQDLYLIMGILVVMYVGYGIINKGSEIVRSRKES